MSFLPLANARMVAVQRGGSAAIDDPYSRNAPTGPQTVWAGEADAVVTEEELVATDGRTTDLMTRTRLVLPAVAALRADDTVTVIQDGVSATYQLATVMHDSAGVGAWPVAVYECSTKPA